MSSRRSALRAALWSSLLLGASSVAGAAAAASTGTGALTLESCHVTDPDGVLGLDAECGTLERAEDPSRPDGRRIGIRVVRVPALDGRPRESAFTVVQGGPGGSSIDLYLTLRGAFEGVRRDRDILLVDQRGTGRSGRLDCPDMDDVDPVLDLGTQPELARRSARACLDALEGIADPRFYTTSLAVADLDAVRSALGYSTLDVYGTSYGTRVALHYLRRHEARVRTIVLDGIVPAGWVLGPTVGPDAQRALDRVFERCAARPDCAARYPEARADFLRFLEALDAEPLEVLLRHPVTGAPTDLLLGRAQLAIAVRMLSYQPETAALLPLLLDLAAAGDAAPLAAQTLLVTEALGDALALGMHNSVVCSEDIAFLDTVPPPAATDAYLEHSVLDAMRAACALWPEGVVDDDFHSPLRSGVPALLLSGSEDPITPPRNGREAAAQLPTGREIVAPGQGHGIVMRGCMPRLLAEFVRERDAAALDTSCVEDLRPAPAFISLSGPSP